MKPSFTWEEYPSTKPPTGEYYQDDQTGSGIGYAWYDGDGDQWYTDETKQVPISAEKRLFARPV